MSLRFTLDHEWLRLEASGEVTVGISAFAQTALGDVVFVQLPPLGRFEQGAEVSVVESVKAASSITMPMAGEVTAANDELDINPELVNESPLDAAWFFRFIPDDLSELDGLMNADAYETYISSQAQ